MVGSLAGGKTKLGVELFATKLSERSLSGCAAWEINCLNCENKGGRSYLTMARLGQVTLVACAPTAYRNNMPPSKKVVRPRATKAMP